MKVPSRGVIQTYLWLELTANSLPFNGSLTISEQNDFIGFPEINDIYLCCKL